MPVHRIRLAPLLILLVAFVLRIYQLDAQSLWYDEGLSIHLASLPLSETMAQSAVTDHPPLHAVILNLWMRLAGSSEFAVRFVSVFFGTLVVGLTYALGRRVGGSRAGVVAAGLIVIAPMAVWYSQEARGYSLLVALILVATLAFLSLMNGNHNRRMWLAYVLACAAALYTHYFAAFPIAAINLVFGVAWLRGRLRALKPGVEASAGIRLVSQEPEPGASYPAVLTWIVAQLAIVVLFLPWLPNALTQAASNATYFPGRVTWDTVVLDTWRAFADGEFPQPPPTGTLWLALILVGMIGGIAGFFREEGKPGEGVLTLISLLGVPLLLMSILAWDRPKFAPRYLLPSLPAFVTLAALGVGALLRFRHRLLAALVLLPLVLIPTVDALVTARIYFDPPVARPDVRSVAAYIDANDDPSDAILLVGGHQAPVFEYYYRGPAEVIPLPADLLPPAQSPLDAHVMPRLADIAAKHPRAWLVLWQENIADPTALVLDELRSHGKRLGVGKNFHEISLLLFDVHGAKMATGPQRALDAPFADPIRLVGFDLDSNEITSSQDLKFALYFESSGPIRRNYQIFTHLIGPDGQIAAQADRIAGADSYPTSLWAVGTRMRNAFDIRRPSGLTSGTYRLIAGLYDDVGRLSLSSGGDTVEIATIVVKP